MKQVLIDLFREWHVEREDGGVLLTYPEPEHARGFYPFGFVRKNDSAADFVDWYGLSVWAEAEEGVQAETARLTITAFFADQKPLKTSTEILLKDKKAKLELPFSLFPLETAKQNRWEFVTGFRILADGAGLRVTGCRARRRRGVYVETAVRGKSGRIGERPIYEGTVFNCADEPLLIRAEQVFDGWESIVAKIYLNGKERGFQVLESGEKTGLLVETCVTELMTPGGHENTRIRVTGQGSESFFEDSVVFCTLCYLPHPYLHHDREGWRRVKENIDRHAPYQPAFEQYRRAAEEWVVTDPMEGRDFCYETKTETALMSAGYMYALTGEMKYAEKLADFYRRFSDPENGYPARKKGCSQSYVQEGHFFKHLAIPYDLICESGALTEADRLAVEKCFRLYMDMLDVHIQSGHISNWILSELHGAFFCALALQDMDRALRFVFGRGGIIEQFRCGIFNDGWWHECSVGYNTWVSSIMLHVAHALRPFGYNLVHTWFRMPFNREVSSVYRDEEAVVKFGMYNQKWGGNRKNYVRIRDMFDATLPFLDYRGVLFGIADSDEKRLSGVHFGSTYDLAWHYYRNPDYLAVIRDNEPDPIFGDPNLDFSKASYSRENAYADNIGIAMLRSRKKGRPQSEQIQAVLRYGSHGNAHGHFDVTDLLSVMRYGRSFYNPENCWWGYAHFMYKFYVQCSLTKNMVAVDEKMQVPADSRRILWQSMEGLQAAGVEIKTRWAYPPYGGMVYEQDGQTASKEELKKRCRMNGCFLPVVEGEGSPGYGELTGFTEEILQRRVMAVADDYIVLFDYAQGQQEHQYDSLMQIKGFCGIDGEQVEYAGHTEQMNANPVSDAQFITDCHWYRVKGGSTARFLTVFTQEDAGERLVCDRSNYNEPGDLHMDVHTAWPPATEQMVGRVAVYDGWAADGNGYTIPLSYELEADGEQIDGGAFDGWILGRGELDADIRGKSSVTLSLWQGEMHDEIGNPVRTPQGVFWGEIILELEDGSRIDLGSCLQGQAGTGTECAMNAFHKNNIHTENFDTDHVFIKNFDTDKVHMENVDFGFGIGRDYRGGRVTIVGNQYPHAIPASPVDHEKKSSIRIDLDGIGAVRLTTCVGVDAFPGDEWQKRKTYAVRTRGTSARFVTVIEPYEKEAMVAGVTAKDPDSVTVTLRDGRQQQILLEGMESGTPQVFFSQSVKNNTDR